MAQVLVVHGGTGDDDVKARLVDTDVELLRRGCGGDPEVARRLIGEHDGRVDAVVLDGLPAHLQLGNAQRDHDAFTDLLSAAETSPVVDGSGLRAGLERWGVILADRAQPGIFAKKRVAMVPGLNHTGLATALARHTDTIRYGDPMVFFGLPRFPGVGSQASLDQAAPPTLDRLASMDADRLHPDPTPGGRRPAEELLRWADVVAGDIGTIRRYAPAELRHTTVVVEHATAEDLDDLADRGASIVVTLMPPVEADSGLGTQSAAVIEGMLATLRNDPDAPLTEDTYLDLLADLHWTPAIHYLQPDEAGVNRFAFVIHALDVDFIHAHPWFRWTRYLPDPLVEEVAGYIPPLWLSKVTGGVSPTTGQRIEGHLIGLGSTPRQMMKHSPARTYRQLNQAAHMAERRGARIMGLGAFTSVVGDAGITVAHEADIAITSGNSLTVAATLEAAKQAVLKMGATDLTRGKVMVVGATGSIASVCSRLLAQAISDVVLVSIEPEKLIELKRTILAETPDAKVTISTRTGDLVGDRDLIVTATSAFGQRVIDLTRCKPGAVICDVARPPDINPAEAALRPDLLVIESGEVLIPGEVDFGYDIGLPPRTAYACLAETALLAMEGRFEDYTLGRNIEMERVKEIYRLFNKHGFTIAGLRSFGRYITDEDIARRRALAEELRADPDRFDAVVEEAGRRLQDIPVMAKGVSANSADTSRWARIGGVATVTAGVGAVLARRRR